VDTAAGDASECQRTSMQFNRKALLETPACGKEHDMLTGAF
jgi:hypothetical protein